MQHLNKVLLFPALFTSWFALWIALFNTTAADHKDQTSTKAASKAWSRAQIVWWQGVFSVIIILPVRQAGLGMRLGPGTSKSQTSLALLSPQLHCPQLLPCPELVGHAGHVSVVLSMHAGHKGLDVCSPGPCICRLECLIHVLTVSKREFSTDLNWPGGWPVIKKWTKQTELFTESSKTINPEFEEELIVIGCPAVTSRIHHHFMNFKDISSFYPCNQWMKSNILLKHSDETLQAPDPGLTWSAKNRIWCTLLHNRILQFLCKFL